MNKKALSLLLCITMALTIVQGGIISVFADTSKLDVTQVIKDKVKEPILAYVPLDNRSVNVDRVIYEAESAGFQVMMPDEDLYATRLDGQPLNSNGTAYGDSKKLLEWIIEMDDKTDYFVISLDQLLSGGLVNSRTLYNNRYFEEYKIINKIIELSQNNHVYIIDTVARLASCTVGYQGANFATYSYLRQYNLIPRYIIKNKDLSVRNIISDYTKDEKGRKIIVNPNYSKDVKTSLEIRKRKLSIIDYILSMDSSGRMKYFIGIDDSNPQNTIQTNEVKFIRKKLGDRGLIYSGADELGMMAVLNLMIDYYGYDVNAKTVYFGDTESSGSGSVYDMETVKENIEKHLKSIGVDSIDTKKADIEIVVLTSPSKSTLNSKYIDNMIDYVNNNISKGIPTIVINSAPRVYRGNLEYRMIRECEMSMLLSYSSWGTVGNSIGLALCNGISRYLYLHSRDNSSDKADIAFLKGLIFSYQKDISYIRGGGKTLFNNYLKEKGWSASNFYQSDEQVKNVNSDLEKILKTSEYNVTVNDIIDNLTDCRYFKGLGGECGIIGKIDLSNYSAPFFRTYEIRFDIDVKLSDVTLKGFKDSMAINMPYAPKEGQLTYSLDLYYLDKEGKLQKMPCAYDKDTGNINFATNIMPNFFTNVLNMEADKATSLFVDVPASAWYFDYIMYVHEKGLMNGTRSNTFEPKKPMTRAMLAYTLYNMAEKPEIKYEEELPIDIGNRWYKTAVQWGLANKIVSVKYDGNFQPNDAVTREELVNILWNYAKYKGIDVKKGKYPGVYSYADVFAVSPELREGFDWACSTGIIAGTSNGAKVLPQKVATRLEVAVVLKRFVEL